MLNLNRTLSNSRSKQPTTAQKTTNRMSSSLEGEQHKLIENAKNASFNLENGKWNSMQDELLLQEDYSFSLNKGVSTDMSDKRVHSFILADKSNSELKNSCASRYAEYLDQFKTNFLQLIREDEDEKSDDYEDDGAEEGEAGSSDDDVYDVDKNFKLNDNSKVNLLGSKLNLNLNNSNILMNSTILSNCFNNLSFHNQHNLSKEADFIEEGPLDDSCSFLMKLNNETKPGETNLPFSKIYKNHDSFSFGSNKRMSVILDELDKRDDSKDHLSFDSVHLGLTNQTRYFYEKRKNEIKYPETYDEEAEHVKISVINLNFQGPEAKRSREYVLTSNGVVKSKKNSATNCLIIGRLEKGEDGLVPNDIILPQSDRAISRVHACLIYKFGFSRRKIPNNFVTFLSGRYPKIGGEGCLVRRIPSYVMRRVYEFLRPEKNFYMSDLGSVMGTYIKLRYNQEYRLRKRDLFLIGAETLIHVKSVVVPTGQVSRFDLN